MSTAPPPPPAVAAIFGGYPASARRTLLAARELVFETAADMPETGPITETLKWNQPSYAPSRPRTGSPFRLAVEKAGRPALLVHCGTRLLSDFAAAFPTAFEYQGNRACYLDTQPQFDRAALALLMARALRYHLDDHA